MLKKRKQKNIRKKILKRSIQIPFSAARKSQPDNEISEELQHFIDNNPLPDIYPLSMVSRHIRHKFVAEGDNEWYGGIILDYDSTEKKHLIQYVGEAETCKFDLILDVLIVDLQFK